MKLKNEKGNVLITNSYGVNNGDMALVIGLYDCLKELGYNVKIATFYYDFIKSKYPDLPVIKELIDYNFLKGGTAIKRVFARIMFNLSNLYRNNDIFIASPGGYLNSYYGIKRSLLPLQYAKCDNKKTAVYSQSIGPLNKMDQKRLTNFSRYIDLILVRDNYSFREISKIPCYSKVYQTNDAAFLLNPRKSNKISKDKLVGVSVREWNYDNRNANKYYNLIIALCNIILDEGYKIEFISTCQGVKNYKDDSKTAMKIKDLLSKDFPTKSNLLKINYEYHTFYELSNMLNNNYDFILGTRLHMCILSLINGTPAFNISYEVKGKECYNYLKLSEYSIDYNEDIPSGTKKLKEFINNFDNNLKEKINNTVYKAHLESKEALTKFITNVKMI